MADPRSLESLTRLERRWLKRRECGLCEAPLHRNTCYAMTGSLTINGRKVNLGPQCSIEKHDQRRGNALASYRPRGKPDEI
jgi:hypothetical protein